MVLHRHVYIVFLPNLPTAILEIPNCLVFKSQMANIPKMLIAIGLLRKKRLRHLIFLHKPEHKHKMIYILILISFQANYSIQYGTYMKGNILAFQESNLETKIVLLILNRIVAEKLV